MERLYPLALTSLALEGDRGDYPHYITHLILNVICTLCAYIKHDLLIDAGRAKKGQAMVGEDAIFGETSRNVGSPDREEQICGGGQLIAAIGGLNH